MYTRGISIRYLSGVREAFEYKIFSGSKGYSRRFFFDYGKRSLNTVIPYLENVEEWLGLIIPSDRERYLLNLERADEVDHLVTAYRINLNGAPEQWVVDYGRCDEELDSLVSGTILILDTLDDAARLMKRFIV
ncbi:hypothetical protein [Cerasicoccus arenae]|uniref:Uncharacterized protein n=1 Tax=Cerasicoccus arenae TaxID=424488 RepID=A0A8J3GCG5_9BACT|nr:hypothetical protein [Cerasicoccus arenae]MBK1858693.1 hypothetical protein [Cerasicoccus arenae]GHB98353.1 hypothetical protein GCM10007047_13040 [Cerasicoccus arenae]